MKPAFFVLLLALSASAQTASQPEACGPAEAKFDIQRDWYLGKNFSPTTPAGKATMYFIQSGSLAMLYVGIDGKWVGATKDDSYFAVSIDPGTHQLCACRKLNSGRKLIDIEAQPDETYYVHAQMQYSGRGRYRFVPTGMTLERIDAHDASRMLAKYPLSVFQEKQKKAKKKTPPIN